MNDQTLKWFDIALEEYKSLRIEVSDSLKNQKSTVSYGITAIGVLVGFGANLWKERLVVEIIFCLFVPAMCHLILFVWNGEMYRMFRAGTFIRTLEEKINREAARHLGVGEQALSWETWLRDFREGAPQQSRKSKRNYLAIITLFLLICLISGFLAYYHYFSVNELGGVRDALGQSGYTFELLALAWVGSLIAFVYHYRYFGQVKK